MRTALKSWFLNSGGGSPPIVLYQLGQSNAAGIPSVSPNSLLTSTYPSYAGEISNVYVWGGASCAKMNATGLNNNQYPVIPDIARNGSFAFEMTLCKDLANATGRDVYLFKYAIGSTGLITTPGNGTWNTTGADIYDDVIAEIALFNAWMDSNVGEYLKSTVLWFQGESDTGYGATGYDVYLQEEDRFVKGIRNAVDPAFYTNWITIGIQEGLGTNYININKSKNILSTITQSLTYKASQGYSVSGDNIHVSAAGQIALGQDLAVSIAANLVGSATDNLIGVPWNVDLFTANTGFIVSGNDISGNGTQNNGKISSKRVIPNGSDGYCEVTLPAGFASFGALVPFGLDASGGIGFWSNFEIGVLVNFPSAGRIKMSVSGVAEGTDFAASEGDVLRIEINSGVITLLQNGNLKHTYSAPQSKGYPFKFGTGGAYAAPVPEFENIIMQCDIRLELSAALTLDLSNY